MTQEKYGHLKLSKKFDHLAEVIAEKPTLKDIMDEIGFQGHAFVVLFFSLPFMQPIPLPGLSVILGLVIAASGLGIIFKWNLRIPKWMGKKEIKSPKIGPVFKGLGKLLSKIEPLLKPRGSVLLDNFGVHLLLGLSIVVSGVVLALPLPPGTNFPPAVVCVLTALGLIEKDAVVASLGLLAFGVMISIITLISVYGTEIVKGFGF